MYCRANRQMVGLRERAAMLLDGPPTRRRRLMSRASATAVLCSCTHSAAALRAFVKPFVREQCIARQCLFTFAANEATESCAIFLSTPDGGLSFSRIVTIRGSFRMGAISSLSLCSPSASRAASAIA